MTKSHPMYRTLAIFIALLLVAASVFLLFIPAQSASAEVVENTFTVMFADLYSNIDASSTQVVYVPLNDGDKLVSYISFQDYVSYRTSLAELHFAPSICTSFSILCPNKGNTRLGGTITFLSNDNLSTLIHSNFGGEISNNTWSGPWRGDVVTFEVLGVFDLTGITVSYIESYFTSADLDDAFDEGFAAGKQFGYDEGFEYGHEFGVMDANSTIFEGSASWTAGYNKGIADSGNYTFYSLIGAVIDVPIQALTSLLNFDFLGINMLSFFTSIFTLLVSIVIAKFVLGFFL